MKYAFFSMFACLLLIVHQTVLADDCPCSETKKKENEWNHSIALGFNHTSGNSDTTLLNLNLNADREKNNNIWQFEFAGAQGESENEKTQDSLDGTAAYKHLISSRAFIGSGLTGLYDQIADIDYRIFIHLSPGYFILKDDIFKFSVEAGPAYIFEETGDQEDNFWAVRTADRFEWKLSESAKLFQTLEYIAAVEDLEDYIINGEVGVEAALTTQLSLVASVKDSYNNIPADDKEQNDVAIITSLKVSL
jgi:putative salt-induced outer membrane protein YdiY